MADAQAIMDSPALLEQAVANLEADFFANSSRLSVSKKRGDVEDLARRAVGDEGSIYPLSADTVIKVAAALKGGGFKSAESYLGELRLGHIEARFDVPSWLARVFAKCKRAVTRGRGPKAKAGELRLDQLPAHSQEAVGRTAGEVKWPFLAYVVANRWLLREIEVAGAKLAHAKLEVGNVVALFLPVSKGDVGGHGTERQLRCCCVREPLAS